MRSAVDPSLIRIAARVLLLFVPATVLAYACAIALSTTSPSTRARSYAAEYGPQNYIRYVETERSHCVLRVYQFRYLQFVNGIPFRELPWRPIHSPFASAEIEYLSHLSRIGRINAVDWDSLIAIEISAGWPWPAVTGIQSVWGQTRGGVRRIGDRVLQYDFDETTSDGPVASRQEARVHVLPLTPLARGLTLNALAFAAILHIACRLLLGTIRIVRSTIRRRYGRCVLCGYSLMNLGNGAVRCPECGHNDNSKDQG